MGLWSTGRYDLRLSDEEFWSMTPREFYALHRRYRDSIELLDTLVASISHHAHQLHRGRQPAKALKDFFLFQRKK
ncbi:MAG TPA: phage tail assembly chaperone [Bryobacteraceae bacterium]|nr:phage tail assembly chaperone [Bryobacteraceae bacterium]